MSTTVATALCTASRSLETEAVAVARALDDGDLAGARRRVRSLVGRDVDGLDADGVVRAVVESVAENTVDAVVAPLLWAAVGGAPAVAVHRAVNTLDAMVGYRTERYRRFGWASARLDDAANWLPARCTAAAVVLVRPGRTAAVVRAVRRDAPAHPSPNAGVAEAAFAGALGCRLGGPTCYGGRLEQRPALGDGPPPGRGDVDRAVALSRQVGAVVAGLTVAVGWLGRGPARRMRWRRRRWSR
jgi:adenosylcobinamide-phosphate synthase